jgi:SAM-dependent methyltransferase
VQGSSGRWNHNTLYHPVIVESIPPACRRALDVGCGEGTLTRELRPVVPEVVGIDTDEASIAAAQANSSRGDIRYVVGDVLTYPFAPGSFDLVTAVASLHHMDAENALGHLSRLLRPGGVLAVVGLARSSPRDLPIDAAAIVPNRVRRLRAPYWQHPSPTVWPPPETYASMRGIAARLLPDARFQRRLYWRYTIVWVKP